MRVILNLDEIVLENLQKMAAEEKRSRKNFMELILINAASVGNPILERFNEITKSAKNTEFGKEALKQIKPPVLKVRDIKPNGGGQGEYNTGEKYPGKLDGESVLDYKIRTSE